MAECQLPKLNTRVRFPSPAPKSRNNLDIVGCKLTVPGCCGFLFVKFLKVKKMPDKNFSNWMDLNYGFRRIENSDGD